MLFWDAHGFEVAECVLGRILPLMAGRPNVVAMHDIADSRYAKAVRNDYGGHPLWKGGNTGDLRLRIGPFDSGVEQFIAILDFATRNRIQLRSADESLHDAFAEDIDRQSELRRELGPDLYSLVAHWCWFSLDQQKECYSFPAYQMPECSSPSHDEPVVRFGSRLRTATSSLLRGLNSRFNRT